MSELFESFNPEDRDLIIRLHEGRMRKSNDPGVQYRHQQFVERRNTLLSKDFPRKEATMQALLQDTRVDEQLAELLESNRPMVDKCAEVVDQLSAMDFELTLLS